MRPTKYLPKYCELLEEHLSKGYSVESFGGVIGVCKDTIYRWVKQYPEFSDAKRVGESKSRMFWEKLGIDHILSVTQSERKKDGTTMSRSKALNSAVWVFNMKNRFKWKDRVEQEVSDNSNRNLVINIVDGTKEAAENEEN